MMNLEEAKTLLRTAVKFEFRDHAFGDCEIEWVKDGKGIAGGYFGGGVEASVWVGEPGSDSEMSFFRGKEAYELRKCFASQNVERNDETGPAIFVYGRTMPGLRLEDVRKKLTGE